MVLQVFFYELIETLYIYIMLVKTFYGNHQFCSINLRSWFGFDQYRSNAQWKIRLNEWTLHKTFVRMQTTLTNARIRSFVRSVQ